MVETDRPTVSGGRAGKADRKKVRKAAASCRGKQLSGDNDRPEAIYVSGAPATAMESMSVPSHQMHKETIQLTTCRYQDEEKASSGVTEDLIRISVGTEHIDDIIADFSQSFKAAEDAGTKKDASKDNASDVKHEEAPTVV